MLLFDARATLNSFRGVLFKKMAASLNFVITAYGCRESSCSSCCLHYSETCEIEKSKEHL
jgi:hypothetical protein